MKNANVNFQGVQQDVAISFEATQVVSGLNQLGGKNLPAAIGGGGGGSIDRGKYNLLLNKTILCTFKDRENKDQSYLAIPVISFNYDVEGKKASAITINRVAVSTCLRLSEHWDGRNVERYTTTILGQSEATTDKLQELMSKNAVFVADGKRKIIPFKLSKIDGARIYYSAEGMPLIERDEVTYKEVEIDSKVKAELVKLGDELVK